MDEILRYFPELTDTQRHLFARAAELYRDLNAQINVISRKDIDNIFPHHILHSLAIAKAHPLPDGSEVMDLGCGGGLPGIPLAIMYPESRFILVDSVGKKIKVVSEVASALGLHNVEAVNKRAEELDVKVDYVVSRAVTDLKPFLGWCWNKIKGGDGHGVLCLKGGDLTEEISEGIRPYKGISLCRLYKISDMFDGEYFQTKKVLYIRKG